MRILVTGSRGFIGRALVPHLQSLGHDVVPLLRGSGEVPADLADIAAWPDFPAEIDAVVHLAALNPSARSVASKDEVALTRANATGTAALAERAAKAGVRRFVFLSTAIVHRPEGASPVRETDPLRPQNPYAVSKLRAEEALQAVGAATGMETVILRPVPVYGPGGRGAVAGLQRLAKLPLPLPFGGDAPRRSVLGVDNCCDAVALSLAHPNAAGETFLVADAAPLTPGEMIAFMRRRFGWAPRVLPFPQKAARLLAGATGRTEALERLMADFVVDLSHIEDRLGWRAPIATAEGLARAMGKPAVVPRS